MGANKTAARGPVSPNPLIAPQLSIHRFLKHGAPHETKQLRDMAGVGKHHVGLCLDDVIHVECEMADARDRRRRLG